MFKIQQKKIKVYLYNEKNINVSENLIAKVFHHLREVLYNYYYIVYESEEFGLEGKNVFFICKESLFIILMMNKSGYWD